MKKLVTVTLVTLFVLGLIGGVAGASVYDKWSGTMENIQNPIYDGFDYKNVTGYAEINYVKGQKNFNTYVYIEGVKAGQEYEATLRSDHITETSLGYFIAFVCPETNIVKGYVSQNHRVSNYDAIITRLADSGTRVNVRLATDGVYIAGSRIASTQNAGELEPVGSNRGE